MERRPAIDRGERSSERSDARHTRPRRLDVAIVNGLIVDGTGAPPFPGTVLVEGDRLRMIRGGGEGGPSNIGAAEVVDARGLAVAPASSTCTRIPMSRTSRSPGRSPRSSRASTQVVGLCGFSPAPVRPETLATMIAEEPVFGFPDVPWDWTTIAGYRESVDRIGVRPTPSRWSDTTRSGGP